MKPIQPSQILDIAQYQIQVLMAEGEHLREAILQLKLQTEDEHEAIPSFLESFLEDIVFEKFGVEMEQTNLAATDLSPQLQDKFHILA